MQLRHLHPLHHPTTGAGDVIARDHGVAASAHATPKYLGSLDDDHLRAVVRTALVAYGFTTAHTTLDAATKSIERDGLVARTEVVSNRLGGFMAGSDCGELERSFPDLWSHLLTTLGMGFRQATLLQALTPVSPAVDWEVRIAGAELNAGIALLDHLVDAGVEGLGLFDLVTEEFICAMFRSPAEAKELFTAAYQRTPDVRTRFLLALIMAWITAVRNLCKDSGNRGAWEGLRRIIVRMYQAEHIVSHSHWGAAVPSAVLHSSVLDKSVLPAVALAQTSRVSSPRSGRSHVLASQLAAQLGAVASATDDLVDLLDDIRQGAPNGVIHRLSEMLADRGRSLASDADLYDAIGRTIQELLAGQATAESDTNRMAGHLAIPQEPICSVHEFCRLMIAGSVRWAEWASPAMCPYGTVSIDGTSDERIEAARAATAFLLAEQKRGYCEAIHWLRLPRLPDPEPHESTHGALLFQRSIVLDALLDARAAGIDVPEHVVNSEALDILQSKHRTVRGGWSYLTDVPELPPDADDLAAVLRVLARIGGRSLASTCDEPIRLALDAASTDGAFRTWILDPRGTTAGSRTVDAYLRIVDGWGTHPEVVANLVLSLMRYDRQRYQQAVVRACGYLAVNQQPSGAWRSRWYAGPYYGTYCAVAALDEAGIFPEVVLKARSFISSRQQPKGDWEDDPTCTALALLACSASSRTAVAHGTAFLQRTQDRDGSWESGPFIQFDTSDGGVEYASRTITTAFCLKAICAHLSHDVQVGPTRGAP